MSRPSRLGARNTFFCKFKNDKKNTCPSLPTATLYINTDLGVNELHCLDCMKREFWTTKGAESVAVGEWGKQMEQNASAPPAPSSSPVPRKKKKVIQLTPEEKDEEEPIPLGVISQASKKRIKKTLLVWNVNDEDKDDDATLQWLQSNEVNLRKQFKEYPDVIDSLSHSLFTLAATRGKIKTMEYLLSLGADFNYVQAKTGDNALSAALYYNQYPAADLLIKKGMTLDVAKELEKDPNRKQTESIPPVERYQRYLRDVGEVKDPEDEPEAIQGEQTVGSRMMSPYYWVGAEPPRGRQRVMSPHVDDDGSETEVEDVYPIMSNASDSTATTVIMSRNDSGVESSILALLPEPSLSRHSSADSLGSLRYSPSQEIPARSFAFDANRVFPGLFTTPKAIKPLFGML